MPSPPSASRLVPPNPALNESPPPGSILVNGPRVGKDGVPILPREKSFSNQSSSLGSDSGSSVLSQSTEATSTSSPQLKFAPLPPEKPRSNSVTLGVAARASLLHGQGGGAEGSGASVPYGTTWYDGGSRPDDVVDVEEVLKKAWGRIRGRRSSKGSEDADKGAVAEEEAGEEGKEPQTRSRRGSEDDMRSSAGPHQPAKVVLGFDAEKVVAHTGEEGDWEAPQEDRSGKENSG